ncbi:MAG: 50S ribosomal protein L44e [Candidatus Acidifodinimicrobium sp.]|jgi:large subunit ribosomal protein L44e|uniref:Large ribosomal subunit protein eL42 n=1 Tax=Candidatus Acidifodinimicrobium mancum TaxID=2898728 RepID=A0A8T3UUD6_9ARCH|nr:50S ribosomal protein L44e [Candidatus Acidifodinimicrobium mancum]MBE5729506.1 50S ribosomal protein L44e [Candidatus Acidifodinimicrobium mancum]
MKIPSKVNRFCKYCGEYTEHTVVLVKPGRRGTMTKGSRRKLWNIDHGYGSTPYPMFEHKKIKVKTTKRYDIRYKCNKCGKMEVQKRGKKAKKLEIK